MERRNIFIYAFPFAILISSLSFLGFYIGYSIARCMDIISFVAITSILTFLGFGAGIALSVVALKMLQKRFMRKLKERK